MFFLKQLLFFLISLLFAVTLSFFLIHCLEGTPFVNEHALSQERLNALCRYYGWDKPLYEQYGMYLSHLLRGDLGTSLVYDGQSVSHLIREKFPVSCRLGIQALIISLPLGIFLGVLAALYKGKWTHRCFGAFSIIGVSIPLFVVAGVLQFLFAKHWALFPIAGWRLPLATFLPTCSLSLLPTAYLTEVVRAKMKETLQQDFVKTARLKGCSRFRIGYVHALRSSLGPVFGYLPTLIIYLLMGSFAVEKIFCLPGLGGWMIASIYARDLPVILGIVLLFTTIFLLASLLANTLQKLIDPRIL